MIQTSLKKSFISLACILLFIQISSCYFSGYQSYELCTNVLTTWSSDASLYTASSLVSANTYTMCGGFYIMGGPGILGTSPVGQGYTRTFSNLPSHNKIHLSFSFWIMDTVDATDYFQVAVDSRTFNTWSTTFPQWGLTKDLCGAVGFADNPNMRVFIQAVHTSSTLNLKFLSYADDASESYGFRDVRIHFVNTSISVSESLCTTPGPGIPSSYLCGGCYEGEYYDTSSKNCLLCHDACTSCYGPSAEDCFQCESGYGWSGTECVKCDPSCNGCHGATSADCEACASGQALWIFSYSTATPLKPYTPKYCAAQSYCVSPLALSVDAYGYYYCKSPCNSDEFVYWDSSCNSTCASPLTSVYETPFFNPLSAKKNSKETFSTQLRNASILRHPEIKNYTEGNLVNSDGPNLENVTTYCKSLSE